MSKRMLASYDMRLNENYRDIIEAFEYDLKISNV